MPGVTPRPSGEGHCHSLLLLRLGTNRTERLANHCAALAGIRLRRCRYPRRLGQGMDHWSYLTVGLLHYHLCSVRHLGWSQTVEHCLLCPSLGAWLCRGPRQSCAPAQSNKQRTSGMYRLTSDSSIHLNWLAYIGFAVCHYGSSSVPRNGFRRDSAARQLGCS